MYNCLIVDDETIILSGIKFLIDWEKMTVPSWIRQETEGMPWKNPFLSAGHRFM